MKKCPSGFRPCLRCHSGKTNGHGLDHSRTREFRPPKKKVTEAEWAELRREKLMTGNWENF